MKRYFLLFVTIASFLAAQSAVGYAVYTASDSTLTFYYGSKPDNAFGLNGPGEMPFWHINGTYAAVKRVVFDSSFIQARPTTTNHWFCDMENLTTITNLNYLNTSIVVRMNYMFSNCKKLTSIDLSGFNTIRVTRMAYMFNNCSTLTSLDLTKFNTSNVETMTSMFCKCSSLTSVNLSSFNTFKVTDMSYMFQGCDAITSLDLNKFNTSKVVYMIGMFRNCNNLTSLNLSSFNTSQVRDMGEMFLGCSKLTSLALGNFNTSNVTNMSSMFYDCHNLKTVKVSNAWSTTAVTYSDDMFSLCTSIVGGAGTTYNSNHTNKEYARIDGGPSEPGYFTSSIGGILGDVNCDGSVNAADVTALYNYILNGDVTYLATSDVNGDGAVNAGDVTAVYNIILGNLS